MNECRCSRPTTAFVCESCADDLSRALGDTPWIEEQLEITMTGTTGIDYRALGGTPSAEIPSPVHWGAASAYGQLKRALVHWVKVCNASNVRNSSPSTEPPADTLTDMSRWLLWRVDGLTLLEQGSDAVDDITNAVNYAHRLIDRRPERQYLGRHEECAGSLYVTPPSTWARCEACDSAVDAEQIKEQLILELGDRLCTAAEIAHLSTYLGLRAGRDQVRKRINQMHRSGKLERSTTRDGDPAYRFGDVYAALVAEEYGRKATA